jgi:hypothetical protein
MYFVAGCNLFWTLADKFKKIIKKKTIKDSESECSKDSASLNKIKIEGLWAKL